MLIQKNKSKKYNITLYFKLMSTIKKKKNRDNYSKPTCGLAGFNIAYLWFKTCHFTHLGFKTLAAVTHLVQFRQKNRSTIKATFFQSIFRVLTQNCCCDSILFYPISDFWVALGRFLSYMLISYCRNRWGSYFFQDQGMFMFMFMFLT